MKDDLSAVNPGTGNEARTRLCAFVLAAGKCGRSACAYRRFRAEPIDEPFAITTFDGSGGSGSRPILFRAAIPTSPPRTTAACSARPSPACFGPNNFITTCSALAERRSADADAAGERARQPKRRLDASLQRRHVSMPDKWEYPWYAAWDLAFHAVVFALIDPGFAKRQLADAHARMVHAPERLDSGLRMGVRRRQPAGACLGRVSHLSDRIQDVRPGRFLVPRARCSRSC